MKSRMNQFFLLVVSLYVVFETGAIAQLRSETKIPVDLIENRFFAKIKFNEVEARVLLDSGGNSGIYPEFAYYWKTEGSKVEKGSLNFSKKSPFLSFPYDILQKQSIRLIAGDEEADLMRKILNDGILGHGWFGGRVWRMDYSNASLSLLESSKEAKGTQVSLGFKSEAHFYPRMQIQVDGRVLNMLFDTGATSFFSEEAVHKLNLKNSFSASNFVRESVYNKWKTSHPDWLVIEGGDRFGNQPLIQVPKIVVAGKEIGPVWFARRSNDAYDKFMAEYMDCKCDGAIGGNVLSKFKTIVLDYPKKNAWLE